MVNQGSEVEFYNDVYRGKPDKWNLEWRDKFAFDVLSRRIRKPGTLLDIGCGNGHTIEYFNGRWPDTAYYGIDLSDVAIEFAKERVSEAAFICGTFENLYVETPPKDVVLLMGVAEHFPDLVGSLSNLKKYGKVIYLESPNCLEYSDNKGEGFRETHEGTGQVEWHLRRDTWEDRITEAGLSIIDSWLGLTPKTEFVWVLS